MNQFSHFLLNNSHYFLILTIFPPLSRAYTNQDCLLGWLLPKSLVAAAFFSYYIELLIYHP